MGHPALWSKNQFSNLLDLSLHQYDGDKDTRGPSDFSGNPNLKMDEVGEDDDEGEDDHTEAASQHREYARPANHEDGVTVKTEYGKEGKMDVRMNALAGSDVRRSLSCALRFPIYL